MTCYFYVKTADNYFAVGYDFYVTCKKRTGRCFFDMVVIFDYRIHNICSGNVAAETNKTN